MQRAPSLLAPFAGDARAREMALERARMSKVPSGHRGIESLDHAMRGSLRPPPGARLAPTPPGALPFLGHLKQFSSGTDRLRAILAMRQKHGDVVRLRFGSINAHIVADPALVEEVFHKRNREFGKATRGVHKLRLVLGRGLLTSEGEFWLRQRRIAQPAFAKRRLASFAERMVDGAEDMVASWRDGMPIDAHRR